MSSLPKSCVSSRENQRLVPMPQPAVKVGLPLLVALCFRQLMALLSQRTCCWLIGPWIQIHRTIWSQWEDSKCLCWARQWCLEEVVMKPSSLGSGVWPGFKQGISCFCSHPCLLILLLFPHRSSPWCKITGRPNKHHPGLRPTGIWGWQSKLLEQLQRNRSHWHHQLPFVYKTPMDLLGMLHQHWARRTAAGTRCLVQAKTTLSPPGSWCARVRQEPSPAHACGPLLASPTCCKGRGAADPCSASKGAEQRGYPSALQVLLLPRWELKCWKPKVYFMAWFIAASNFLCCLPPWGC